MKRIIVCLLIICINFYTLLAQRGLKGIEKNIDINGEKREFILFKPEETTITKMPLIIAMHGSSGTMKQMEAFFKLNEIALKAHFMVIYPQGKNRTWAAGGAPTISRRGSDADDDAFIAQLIDEAVSNYGADVKKIFLTGISRGGIMAIYLAGKLKDKITAIAPVAASLPAMTNRNFNLTTAIPMLIMNGTEDPLIPYNGGLDSARYPKNIIKDVGIVPTETLVKRFVNANHCNEQATIEEIPDVDKNDGAHATKYIYTNGKKQKAVVLIKIVGGGHTFPNGFQYLPATRIGNTCRDFDGAEEIWSFFKQF